ncbi:hypothetical protein SeMB42_g06734 [Synchytrium endobioticum]|uniref:RNA helicase n=2 Tax=Synchytrium endobioticum TaxID=286115 RepID=A0A507CJI5_9FUNG|nr:hypothetical protein SeMB42_g06734 [Synchytrium endobioticum]
MAQEEAAAIAEEARSNKRKGWNLDDDEEDEEDAGSRAASPVNLAASTATVSNLGGSEAARSTVPPSPVQPAVKPVPKPISRILGKPVKGSNIFIKPLAPTKSIVKPKLALGYDDDDSASSQAGRRLKIPRLDRAPNLLAPINKMGVDDDGEANAKNTSTHVSGDDEPDALDVFMQDVHQDVAKVTEEDKSRMILENASSDASTAANYNSNSNNPDEDGSDSGEEEDDEDIMSRVKKQLAAKKKDFAQVDHSTMNYEPFRKDFFVEPPDLVGMNKAEVDMLRAELDGIKIRGVNPPKPVVKWTQFGLPVSVFNIITRVLKFEKPSPIQAQSIPAIMSGRDVIGIAKTGSGKTMAFLLPLFRHIKDQRPLEPGDGPIALIMTPTRELAVQIFKDSRHFVKIMEIRAVCAYGGSPIKDQIAELKRGAEIIICTPGRMIDLLCANSGRVTNLKRVTYLVLDEADRMFDMGFEPQVMKIVNNVRPSRQTVLFSATFPRQMEALARKILTKPLEITVGGRSVVSKDVTQHVELMNDDEKFIRLLDILGRQAALDADAKSLIFVNQQEAADNLLRDLMRRGYPCLSLHGGKDQQDRESTIADFKSGDINIMIATSVAARGLDVKNLTLVINYECPNHMEDYVHRCGRTGRAGNKGEAYTFITPSQDRYAVDIVKALKMSGVLIPEAVQKLADEFMAKVKEGKAQYTAGGFGGKGLEKLDKERESLKKIQKREHGDEGDADASDDETDEEDIFEDDGDFKFRARAVNTISAGPRKVEIPIITSNSINSTNNAAVTASIGSPATAGSSDRIGTPPSATNATTPSANTSTLPQPVEQTAEEKRRKAVLLAQRFVSKGAFENSGKKGTRPGEPEAAFALEIEINDYPQKARWKVTNKENITQIAERTGAAITTRGLYFAAGTNPPPGERKLYLLVEGPDELTVSRAKKEIRRTLEESTLMALEHEEKEPQRGRFRITF